MINLVPEWAYHYGEFWRAIKIRNLWFIRLRYLADIILLGFLLIGQLLLDLNLSHTQIVAIGSIIVFILFYNAVLHFTRKYVSSSSGRFNGLHLSLIQMVLDLSVLMVLVYFTGSIESPLYMFFIFHMIIGSLILPGYIVYAAAGLVSFVFALITFLQRYHQIESHFISGLYSGVRPHTFTYDLLFVIIFAVMMLISVYIANKIAHQLYKREQQLRTSLEKINEAEIAKQKYIIGIVHEIKTPIAAVHSILELIKHGYVGPVSDSVNLKIDRAELRTEEALQLIKNVLNISKLRLLEITLDDEIDLNIFIENIIDTFSEAAREKSISMKFIDDSNKNVSLKSDKILLELIISNLISNSIKYGRYGGIIEITLTDHGEYFSIEICDDGIGIPKEELGKIFTQFFRASNIDKLIHEGSGMGLAVVKEIVEKLGGSIKVGSPSRLALDEKPGSTFEVSIPYRHKPIKYDIFEVNNDEYLDKRSNS